MHQNQRVLLEKRKKEEDTHQKGHKMRALHKIKEGDILQSLKKIRGTCQICGGEGFIETQCMQAVYSAGFLDILPLM